MPFLPPNQQRQSTEGTGDIVSRDYVISITVLTVLCAFSALTLLVGRQEGHPVVGAGVVICLERDADLHMAQMMPLPLTVSCSSKIQIGFTFLVPAYPGCPGKEAVKWLLLLLTVLTSALIFRCI